MKLEFPHSLPKAEARARLEALGEYLTNRHHIDVTWNGDRATFSGRFKKVVKIRGELSLGDGIARFEGDDPGFAWRGQAKKYIQRKLNEYLDANTPLDALPRG
ncbi:MAG: hypothetical protein D6689_04105 [Deltaproteobacteria bacterium]|nr:MAG: hypothetical protein D6689_04105 [Deltaproteobacteria bacterium]